MGDSEPFFWVEEHTGQLHAPVGMKRKARTKKMEFVGWGSRALIDFLESIGTDTSKQISQYDVAAIINKYVNDHSLHHPAKKKRILCDEWLLSLFGRKTIAKIRIYNMLGAHFAENQMDTDDDFLFSSEEDDAACERQKNLTSERKIPCMKKVLEAPKSQYAAIIPDNIKLIYLKRSLVQDLLKDPEMFEGKIVGSIVRVKSDPNDYLQKNSHLLVQVTGLKKACGSNNRSTEIVLQVSNYLKDVHISMLSDDNFSEEECDDLHQRIRDGLLKRPTVVELEEKVQVLHKDITNHWLVREFVLLQKLIDRANEKGWRKELFEYLERRQLLETPDEQTRLLCEVPKVIPDEIEVEGTPQDFPENIKKGDLGSPESTTNGSSEILNWDVAAKETPSAWISFSLDSKAKAPAFTLTKQNSGKDFQHSVIFKEQQKQPTDIGSENKGTMHPLDVQEQSKDFQRSVIFKEQQKQPTDIGSENKGTLQPDNVQGQSKGAMDVQVIDLSDDEESEDSSNDAEILDLESFIWNYADPQGTVQGPFSIKSLKRWYDADYFPPGFKVWKMGQSQNEAVLLSDILQKIFPY